MAVSYDFTGRTVLVTGGTRGIGAGIAVAFLAAGADVAVCARHEPAKIPAAGREAFFVRADVRDPAEVDRLITEVTGRTGRLDVLVNNAGGTPTAMVADAPPRLHAKIIELNLVAPLLLSRRAYLVMRDQPDGGAIIMIGSTSGVRPSPGTAAYGAAKAGLHQLSACLAAEWAPDVRVNTVIVGLADSGEASAHYGGPAGLAAVATTVPVGRVAAPQDVAQACLYLAAPSYVTGASLLVHGGGETPAWADAAWTHSADESWKYGGGRG
jgi:NAD(P)-dependent dehydrogenase (short-subunit alcohol dehydrogenase family)